MKNALITIIIILLAIFAFVFYFSDEADQVDDSAQYTDDEQQVNDEEPYNSMEEPEEHSDIKISSPKPGQVISSPLIITGEAKGFWLFEATAPVVLTDWDGKIIAESYISAEGEWMTESFVPVSGTLEFETPEDIGDFSDWGSIIFQKSNPSGLPENDDAYEFRVRFR